MHDTNANEPGQGSPSQPDGDAATQKEDRLLARVRDVAQRITDRVKKTLADTESHEPLGTEEHPPVP